MAVKGPERWSVGIPRIRNLEGPAKAIGGLFSMADDAIKFAFVRPFQWREFLEQCWFVARVSLAPTLLVRFGTTANTVRVLHVQFEPQPWMVRCTR